MKYKFKRGRCLNPEREFILCTETWYIQYQFIQVDTYYQFGLTLRYLGTGTDFKYIFEDNPKYGSEMEMKKAIKSEVAKWMIEKQKEHDIKELPVGQLQEFINPQLTLF